MQQGAVHNAEDGRIGADPERERDNGGQGEGWSLDERAARVAKILPQLVKEPEAERVAALLLHVSDAAERTERRRASSSGAHPGGDVLSDLLFQVELQFGIELPLDPRSPKQRTKRDDRSGCPAHEQPHEQPRYVVRTTRLIACERRFQCASSASSRLRPAVVNE